MTFCILVLAALMWRDSISTEKLDISKLILSSVVLSIMIVDLIYP